MPADAKNPRDLPKSRVAAQRFLELYAEHGQDYGSILEFCDALGLSYGYFNNLRSKNLHFKAAVEKLAERGPSKTAPKTRAPALARKRWPGLELWKGIFVERYRETVDRVLACELIEPAWYEIERELLRDPAFKAAFETVELEIRARAEDAMKRSALRGGGLSKSYLAAAGSALGKKAKAPSDAKAEDKVKRETFRDLLARHQAVGAVDSAPEADEIPTQLPPVEEEEFLSAAEIDSIANEEDLAGPPAETPRSELAAS